MPVFSLFGFSCVQAAEHCLFEVRLCQEAAGAAILGPLLACKTLHSSIHPSHTVYTLEIKILNTFTPFPPKRYIVLAVFFSTLILNYKYNFIHPGIS